MSYVVKKGESLSVIGKNLKIDWLKIAKLNNLKKPYVIYPGQSLKLPGEKEKVKEVDKIMRISPNGINLIKKFEGCRLTAYKAVSTEKYYTIGWGHYGSDIKAGQKITQSQADSLFLKDIQKYVDGVNNAVKIPISQSQFDSLVSLAYNIGVGGMQGSSVVAYVNKGQFDLAGNAFGQYVHAGGKVLQGLVTRRKAEKELFLNGGSVSSPILASGGGGSSLGSKIGQVMSSPIVWGVLFTGLLIKH